MPLCSLHLIRLEGESTSKPSADGAFAVRRKFLRRLLTCAELDQSLLVACVVRRPVIVATRVDHVRLNKTPWDFVLLFQQQAGSSSSSTPASVYLASHSATKALIADEYVLQVGIPTRIIDSYASQTQTLNAAAREAERLSIDDIAQSPARTTTHFVPTTSQLLEYSDDLRVLVDDLHDLSTLDGLVDARGPVQQLNLLAFGSSKEDQERYHKYGQSFAEVAQPFGGQAKVLGKVVDENKAKGWQEIALVSYHSIDHFAAMAASEAYQEINRAYRLPSLDDTTIVCTQEVDLAALRARLNVSHFQQSQL